MQIAYSFDNLSVATHVSRIAYKHKDDQFVKFVSSMYAEHWDL